MTLDTIYHSLSLQNTEGYWVPNIQGKKPMLPKTLPQLDSHWPGGHSEEMGNRIRIKQVRSPEPRTVPAGNRNEKASARTEQWAPWWIKDGTQSAHTHLTTGPTKPFPKGKLGVGGNPASWQSIQQRGGDKALSPPFTDSILISFQTIVLACYQVGWVNSFLISNLPA